MIEKYDFNTRFVSSRVEFYQVYSAMYDFCVKAENESKLLQTKHNMKGENWDQYTESLLWRIYKSDKYRNGNGALSLLYDKDGICAVAGVERYNSELAIMSKRLYVLRKYRFLPINSTYFLNEHIKWAKRKKMKACLITVNEYQKKTVLQIIKRIRENKATSLGGYAFKNGSIYDEMQILEEKVHICDEDQYVGIYKIDKDFDFKVKDL